MSSALLRPPPIICIVGATGTGKSQLAVTLAERFNGEIVNGDALQLYEGLPITTNKISAKEQRGVAHHLLGCVSLKEEPWTVQRFHQEASRTIDKIRARGRLPIVVGGTHYYTQSLLFPESLVENVDRQNESNDEEDHKWPILAATSEEMLEELKKVDPVMAQRWHPRDARKIRRSLQIWLQTGTKASDIYHERKREALKDPVQTHDPLIFWTYSSPAQLDSRLDDRVDGMLSAGLCEEVRLMRQSLVDRQCQGSSVDESVGIWIAIGYKELVPYIESQSEEDKLEGVERIKIATRQYAKRQSRWIRHKLLHAVKESALERRMYLLDATDISQFALQVEGIATRIAAAFLAGEEIPHPTSLSDLAGCMLQTQEKEARYVRHCEMCNKITMSDDEWVRHLKSKGHRSALRPKVDWQALYPRHESD